MYKGFETHLALILIFSRWDQVKKIIIGKEKVEVQIPEKVIESGDEDDNKIIN